MFSESAWSGFRASQSMSLSGENSIFHLALRENFVGRLHAVGEPLLDLSLCWS